MDPKERSLIIAIFTSFDPEDAKIDVRGAEEFLEEMKKYLTQNHGIEF